ncbi:MAG: putative phage protein [Gemmatimonadetes bacterium]|nr:putative phage protein [Gemmatimonadota bacterium]
MSGIILRYLAYFGPERTPADLSFEPGLNVICGASETGKTFVVESIDFMLGQGAPVRDIPERHGYDRVRLALQSDDGRQLTLDRSVEGGEFRAYEELLERALPEAAPKTLRWRHNASHRDTLSHVLLSFAGLPSKVLRRNLAGATRSLSFRDMARLCVVNEEEIQGRGSPFLSGQYTTATSEYAAFKLLLTGVDDSALVGAETLPGRREQDAGKIELLDHMIDDLEAELDEKGSEEAELDDQLARLNNSIRQQNEALATTQKALDVILERRSAAATEIRSTAARVAEIDELVERFGLLDRHYQTDLDRLAAIHESGSLFVHLEKQPCPLCGAAPGNQHLDTDCEGNTEAIVTAAEAEMVKIARLQRELEDTTNSLAVERQGLLSGLHDARTAYKASERELNDIASPAVLSERASYNVLVSKRAEILAILDKVERLKRLTAHRADLDPEQAEVEPTSSGARTQVSKTVLNEFAQTVERILQEWHFPNATRVFFDEAKRDFQIAGKDRGSTGKGLRAITHAAVKIGLMEFCRERSLPHPGFVVLDSPLLAYWKPEGDEDDLRGSDLKEMFYSYLLGLRQDNQLIIVENEHPPDSVLDRANVTVFTKNPHQGRYGFFPGA